MQKIGEKIIAVLLVITLIPVLLLGIFLLKDKNSDEKQSKISMYGIEEEQEDTDNIQDTINNNYPDFLTDNENTNKEPSDSQSTQNSGLCTTKQISYSMENLNKTSVCNQYQDNICINKTVYCLIDIYNKDNEISGFFDIQIFFIEENKTQQDAIDVKTFRFSLSPDSKQIITTSTNIKSSGEDGLANKKINCLFNTLEVPTKEVCL